LFVEKNNVQIKTANINYNYKDNTMNSSCVDMCNYKKLANLSTNKHNMKASTNAHVTLQSFKSKKQTFFKHSTKVLKDKTMLDMRR